VERGGHLRLLSRASRRAGYQEVGEGAERSRLRATALTEGERGRRH